VAYATGIPIVFSDLFVLFVPQRITHRVHTMRAIEGETELLVTMTG
jgi:hypothetical protein